MTQEEMLTHVDHTLLTQTATWSEIKQILDFRFGNFSAISAGSAAQFI